ncbi:MAG: N-6 DNA methylase [Sulfuricurvum sp.]|uniref:type I restriction-modification system subunit M n=1 Tax=Sulfuricurvum sp. TaxID=2025608 RepID=UPI0027346C01|nr:type I restriction-modification system subunit M [Sulfuricurvum sp.]MDP2851566.1 N-6 DNA methylase [Sulfuricurvum sp.]
MLQNNPQLKSLIDKLWNKFWAGGISNPLTAIEQITYLIFMKRLDELDTKRKANAEWTEEQHISIFDGVFPEPTEQEIEDFANGKADTVVRVKKQTLRWNYVKELKSEEMLTHIQQYVFPFIKQLGGESSHFVKHMKNAVFIIPSASLLVEAISIIEDLFKEIDKDAKEQGHAFQDIQGDVYEMLLSEIATAGKNGQFRTPRHIIKLIAELVEPKLGDKVGDPACGTGGFLLGAYQYIVSSLDTEGKFAQKDEDGFTRSSTSALLTADVKSSLDGSFHGYDIDVTMVRLGLMNLMMHGIDDPQIDYMDTLSKKFNHSELNSYDVILANPPFTGNLNKGEIDSESLTLNTTKTELLFIDRIYTLLRQGGTAGVIVPQGVLFGTGKAFQEARRIMIEESQLKAVISMPSGVFKPYAGVATAILIFTKAGVTDNVWFYEMVNDGYSLDDKRTKIDKSDLQDIADKYKTRNVMIENDRKAKHFFVTKNEISENNYNLSLNNYKEEEYTEIQYEAPLVILNKLLKNEIGDISENELKKVKSGIVRELLELKEMIG